MQRQLSTTVFLLIFIHVLDSRVVLLKKRAFSYIANDTVCVVDNAIYYDGNPIPTDDPCEFCRCRPPGFSCVLRECEMKPGCKAIRREGECCPQYQCGCEHNGNFFKDGDKIPIAESPCYSCYCQGSSITCALADCKFRFDCPPEYVTGECCPRYDHCPPESTIFTKPPQETLLTTANSLQISSGTTPKVFHSETTKDVVVEYTETATTVPTLNGTTPENSGVGYSTTFTTLFVDDNSKTINITTADTSDKFTTILNRESNTFPSTGIEIQTVTETSPSRNNGVPDLTESSQSEIQQITTEFVDKVVTTENSLVTFESNNTPNVSLSSQMSEGKSDTSDTTVKKIFSLSTETDEEVTRIPTTQKAQKPNDTETMSVDDVLVTDVSRQTSTHFNDIINFVINNTTDHTTIGYKESKFDDESTVDPLSKEVKTNPDAEKMSTTPLVEVQPSEILTDETRTIEENFDSNNSLSTDKSTLKS